MMEKELQLLCNDAVHDVNDSQSSIISNSSKFNKSVHIDPNVLNNSEAHNSSCTNSHNWEDNILSDLRNPLKAWKNDLPVGISHAWANGKKVPMLKVMQTNICKFNCNYCATRCDNNHQRVTISPEKLAKTFISMFNAKLVKGLFLIFI